MPRKGCSYLACSLYPLFVFHSGPCEFAQEWKKEKELEAREQQSLLARSKCKLERTITEKDKLAKELRTTHDNLRREREERQALQQQIQHLRTQLNHNESERKESVCQQLDSFKQV